MAGSVRVADGRAVRFDTVSTDPDGLGCPVFAAFGNDTLVSHIWDFDGGQAGPVAVFVSSPLVTFALADPRTPETRHLSLSVFDTLGNRTEKAFDVEVSDVPHIEVLRMECPWRGAFRELGRHDRLPGRSERLGRSRLSRHVEVP